MISRRSLFLGSAAVILTPGLLMPVRRVWHRNTALLAADLLGIDLNKSISEAAAYCDELVTVRLARHSVAFGVGDTITLDGKIYLVADAMQIPDGTVSLSVMKRERWAKVLGE